MYKFIRYVEKEVHCCSEVWSTLIEDNFETSSNIFLRDKNITTTILILII